MGESSGFRTTSTISSFNGVWWEIYEHVHKAEPWATFLMRPLKSDMPPYGFFMAGEGVCWGGGLVVAVVGLSLAQARARPITAPDLQQSNHVKLPLPSGEGATIDRSPRVSPRDKREGGEPRVVRATGRPSTEAMSTTSPRLAPERASAGVRRKHQIKQPL